jgi:hypothetical protein
MQLMVNMCSCIYLVDSTIPSAIDASHRIRIRHANQRNLSLHFSHHFPCGSAVGQTPVASASPALLALHVHCSQMQKHSSRVGYAIRELNR